MEDQIIKVRDDLGKDMRRQADQTRKDINALEYKLQRQIDDRAKQTET